MEQYMVSFLQNRLQHRIKIPHILHQLLSLHAKPIDSMKKGSPEIRSICPKIFDQPTLEFEQIGTKPKVPLKLGILLSGGPAPGGHNVIAGIFDAIKKFHSQSSLVGFLLGPEGVIMNNYIPLTSEIIESYRNTGGFDLIGTGRTKIEKPEQFAKTLETVKKHALDGLVIIGGDDSNTNAALLAEYFLEKNIPTRVIGVPKTIDGDLKGDMIETSFGFDTASKTYAHTIGSLCRDAISQKKYYFFVKLMGRSASHITLECALETHPNYALISEEVKALGKSLSDIVIDLTNIIVSRAEAGKNYGVFLIPEGLMEFIPECKQLIENLNCILAKADENVKQDQSKTLQWVDSQLDKTSRELFACFPKEIQKQLIMDRDPHGNVQVSKIETDQLLIQLVKDELKKRKENGKYKGKFAAQGLFIGYEGRSCFPSNFDANYSYSLGLTAALLVSEGVTGYMSCIRGLADPVESWQAYGIPITSMMVLETRQGNPKPVIQKSLVNLNGLPFNLYKEWRNKWSIQDDYQFPPPIQFFGPQEFTEQVTRTLRLELQKVPEFSM
jgi:pyrophosphate--fructose-6-phosphate 1-phosphotransferase